MGTLTSWNPLGLSRPVMGLLYLFIQECVECCWGVLGEISTLSLPQDSPRTLHAFLYN